MPDSAIRFALGDPEGMSSLSWKVWVTNRGDAYVSCRDHYQVLKVSLHRSGRWRVGLTSEGADATAHLRPAGANRAWDLWERPEAEDGVVVAYRILFLPSEFRVTPQLRQALDWKGVEFITVPTAEYMTVATISINRPGIEMRVAGSGDQARGILDMPDGNHLQLTFHTELLGDEFRLAIAAAYRHTLDEMRSKGLTPPEDGRLLVAGGRDEARFAVELNIERPDPDPLEFL